MAKGAQPKLERNRKIVEYRDKRGMTFNNIARMLNLSQPRTWEIYRREKKKLELQRA